MLQPYSKHTLQTMFSHKKKKQSTFLTVGIYKFDVAFLKFLYCLYIILHYSQHFFVVSTHWVGYVHNIFKLYTAPYKQTKKDRLLKKAPLEVRHNEGGSFLSASGFLCLLHTLVKLLVEIASAALPGVTAPVWHNGSKQAEHCRSTSRLKIVKVWLQFEVAAGVLLTWKQAHCWSCGHQI